MVVVEMYALLVGLVLVIKGEGRRRREMHGVEVEEYSFVIKFVDLVLLVGQVRLSFGFWTKGVLSVFRMSYVKQIQESNLHAWIALFLLPSCTCLCVYKYIVAREPLKARKTLDYGANLGHPKSPTTHIYRLC